MALEPLAPTSLPHVTTPSITSVHTWAHDIVRVLKVQLDKIIWRLNIAVLTSGDQTVDGAKSFALPPRVPSYTVATLPSAASYARGLIYVSNEAGGAVIAFSDGTNWRRVTDRAIVS